MQSCIFILRSSDQNLSAAPTVAMDPHSRFSPFNSRQTKTGPVASSSRFMESHMKQTKPLEDPKRPPPPQKSSSQSASALYTSRPIATNSRIKQGGCNASCSLKIIEGFIFR